MARTFPQNSATQLIFSGAVIPSAPTTYTISAWYRPTTLGISATVYAQTNTGGHSYLGIGLNTANKVQFFSRTSDSTATDALSSTTADINNWHHLCGVQASTTLRTAYLDGGNTGTSTSSQNPLTAAKSTIGVFTDGTSPASPAAGDIAEVACWSVALDSNEVLSLSRGASPLLIRPSGLLSYWQLFGRGGTSSSDEADIWRGHTMAHISTMALAPHTRVLYPRRKYAVGYGIPFLLSPRDDMQGRFSSMTGGFINA